MYFYPKALSKMSQLSCCLRLEAGQSSPPSLPWACFSQQDSPLHPQGASSCSQHGAKPAQQHGKRGEGTGGLHLNVGTYITRGISLGSPHRRDGAYTVFTLLLLPKFSPCPSAGPRAPALPGAAGGTGGWCLMHFFTSSLRTMVRCRQVQYMLPALLAYFVLMYKLDTFSNLLGETLYWIRE